VRLVAMSAVVVGMELASCRGPEQPRVPPGPTNPTNARAEAPAAAPAGEVIDASIVSEAGEFDAAVLELDSGAAHREGRGMTAGR